MNEAGLFTGEITQLAPADASPTTKQRGFCWFEHGISLPPALNCNEVWEIAVLTPDLHIGGEVADVWDGDIIIGTGPLVDDRIDAVWLPNDADNYTIYPSLSVGEHWFNSCQWYNYSGPLLTNDYASPNTDLTDGWTEVGTGTVTFDQIGISGVSNQASLVTNTSSSDRYLVQKTAGNFSIDNNPFCGKLVIKKEISAVSNARLLIGNIQSPQADISLKFNAQTGLISIISVTASNTAFEVRDYGDWWEVTVQLNKNGSVGNKGLWLIDPAYNDDGSTIQDLTVQGSITIGEVAIYEDVTIGNIRGGAVEPRFGPTGSVIDISNIHVPASNHSNTEGGYYIEWRPMYSQSEISGHVEILSLNDAVGLLYYDHSTKLLTSTDGTNIATVALILVKERKYHLGVVYGSSSLRVGVDGVWGTQIAYDGGFAGGGLFDILRNPEGVNYWRELRGYQDTYANVFAEIDLLMG